MGLLIEGDPHVNLKKCQCVMSLPHFPPSQMSDLRKLNVTYYPISFNALMQFAYVWSLLVTYFTLLILC